MKIKKYFLSVPLFCFAAVALIQAQGQIVNSGAAQGAALLDSLSALGAAGGNPFEVRCISQEHIDMHTKKITRSMKLHRYIGTAAKLGGAAIFLFAAYQTLASWRQNRGGGDVVPETVTTPARMLTEKDGLELSDALKKANPAWFTYQWWKNNTLWIVNSVALSVGLGYGTKLMGRFVHEDTLEWYAAEHTKIKELADELSVYHSQTLAKGAAREFSEQDLYFHRMTLAGIARDVVAQAEAIGGFMEYRLAYFKSQGVVLLPNEFLQPTRLIASVNACVQSLEGQLVVPAAGTDSLDQVKKLCGLVMQCATELQQMINRFQGNEYSIQWRIINGE